MRLYVLVQRYLFRDILKTSESLRDDYKPSVVSSTHDDQSAFSKFTTSVPILDYYKREDFDSIFSDLEIYFENTNNLNIVHDETSTFFTASWIV
jgi:hypothetical protein